ncbi:hypothetical protein J6590_065086 [Homalodisca vitripennis]|nr:hypothetical protein J6590_065086 [Homalodisca vitripennis]
MASVQEKARCVLWFHESRSVITVQRRFRLEYGRNPPSNNSIKRWYRQFEQTGSVQHRKGAGRPPVSEAVVDQVRELFTRSPARWCPPHWGKIVRDYLNDTFPGRWIGRDGPIPWPPRSPDITPLDFFCGAMSRTESSPKKFKILRNSRIEFERLLKA